MPSGPATATRLRAVARSRFLLLLVFLIVLFAVHPILPERSGRSLVHLDVAFAAVLLGGIWSVSHRRSLVVVGSALVVPALAATSLAHAGPSHVFAIAGLGCSLAFLLFTAGSVVWNVVRAKTVSTDTILGGICAYLLLGAVWALVFSLLEAVAPGSFRTASGTALEHGDPGALLVPDLLYYSIFTLTTMGPQDLHPFSRVAIAWTGLEGMTGQLYVAILIARLVGQHTARAGRG